MILIESTFGAWRLWWGEAAPVELGTTFQGARLRVELDVLEQRSVYTGSTPCGFFVAGRRVSVEVELGEAALRDVMSRLMGAVERIDPGDGANVAHDLWPFAGGAWPSERLRVRPVGVGADASGDVVLWKASLRPPVEAPTRSREGRVFALRFEALADADESGRARLARVGDWSIEPSFVAVGE